MVIEETKTKKSSTPCPVSTTPAAPTFRHAAMFECAACGKTNSTPDGLCFPVLRKD